jgi:mono/diheme cytochrome c family protein
MNQLARYSLAACLLFAADRTQFANAQNPTPRKTATAAPGVGDAERGRYIVEGVAMCERCHTPQDSAGQSDARHRLEGAPVLQPVAGWAIFAPRLAGRPPGTDEEFVRLLTTGISRTGTQPRHPMPPFRMTRPDAEAVLAYLKSLRR